MEEKEVVKKEETKKGLSEKQVFWLRFVGWVLFAAILPVAFIIWRFNLFTERSPLALSGWGFMAIVIIALFIISLLKYVRAGLPYSLFSQCVTGFCKVILPLVIFYAVLYCIQQNLGIFLQALGCVILCELVAIPLNPMPKWIHDNVKEEDQKKFDSMTDVLWDKFFSRKDKEGE